MARVLVVDDDQNIATLVCEVLRDEGHEVAECHDAREAFRQLCEHRHDLLISDIQMPGEDGLSLLARLRALGLMQNVPVVFITGCVDEGYRREAKALGAATVLTKPFAVTALLDSVAELLATISPAAPEEPMSRQGSLETLRVADLCYLVAMSGKSLRIALVAEGKCARLRVAAGKLVYACAELEGGAALTGEEAFFEVAGWKSGRFEIDPVPAAAAGVDAEENVPRPLESLLLDAAERQITTRQWRR